MTIKHYLPLDALHVRLDFGSAPIPVGRLAYKNRRIYFEYDRDFPHQKLPISPFMLPLKAGVQEGDPQLFEGLFGVFNDSLPDGWGRLLLDRLL
jgi:serine/threonine-protein kinase HipA